MIPARTKEAIDRYVNEGIEPGGFTKAVLMNDLCAAVMRADETNSANLKDIVQYVYDTVPIAAFGSSKTIDMWIRSKYIEKEEAADEKLRRIKAEWGT